jgi:hypothetical protein
VGGELSPPSKSSVIYDNSNTSPKEEGVTVNPYRISELIYRQAEEIAKLVIAGMNASIFACLK